MPLARPTSPQQLAARRAEAFPRAPHDLVDLRRDLPEATLLLDARWWHVGGTGAMTRSLVRGLHELDPDHRWILWGPDELAEASWPGSYHVPTEVSPSQWFGQRQAFRLPRADLVLHPHQTRPAHTRPAASCVLDLIQLRHPNPVVRQAMRRRLASTIRHAAALFTIAPSVRDEIAATFGTDRADIQVLHLPVDQAAARAVRVRRHDEDLRGDGGRRRALLAVGGFSRHKNQRRLIDAFAATRFAATGGELHLAGGTVDELGLTDQQLPVGVRVLGRISAAVLEEELVAAVALVQPSLVEGYGLPVAEAIAAGVPVLSSPVPAATELGPAGLPTFDPTSTADMATAIDATVEAIEAERYWTRVDRDRWIAEQPDDVDLACQVLAGIAPVLARR